MTIESLTQPFNVDVKANRINRFDQQWYQIVLPDKEVDLPSVTTYLDVFPKGLGFKLWLQNVGDKADSIRNEAGQLGSHVHKIIEMTLRGESVSFENLDGTRNCSLEEWERYMSWCLWYQDAVKNAGLKPLYIEQIVHSVELEMAGTIDLIAETKLGIFIFDWKSGSFVGDTAEIQVSTYITLANRMEVFGNIVGGNIVQLHPSLNKKGFRASAVENVDVNFQTMLNCQQIWKRVNKNAKPKYKIYPNEVSLEYLNNEILNFTE